MASFYEPALPVFEKEVNAIRRLLLPLDATVLQSDTLVKERAAHGKAFAYVWLAAALEEFIAEILRSLLRELTSSAVPQRSIRPSLLSMACFSVFDSLKDVGGLKQWERRVEVLHRSVSDDVAVFAEEELPLDGRTIKPTHLSTIWLVLGLPGSPLPSPRHSLALIDLAEGRNKIAHGREAPLSFGRKRVTADVLRIVDYIEEIATHVAISADHYISHKLYLR